MHEFNREFVGGSPIKTCNGFLSTSYVDFDDMDIEFFCRSIFM